MKAWVEWIFKPYMPSKPDGIVPILMRNMYFVMWWGQLSPSSKSWEWTCCTSQWLKLVPTHQCWHQQVTQVWSPKALGGLDGRFWLKWHSHCPTHSALMLWSGWWKHTNCQSRKYAMHGWRWGMLGLPMARRWKTEMGKYTLVMMVFFFFDDAVVDSDVDSNLFEGGCWGNKKKQKKNYNLNQITHIKMDW